MGQSAVTQERLDAATRMLAEAARKGEIGPQEVPSPATPPESAPKGGDLLQLVVTPDTLLKLAGSGTKELVITINERV